MQKINVKKHYNLPDEVKYCAKCVASNQRPRVVFDEEGVCNACRYAEKKHNGIDWNERERELKDLCDRFRHNDGTHDVVAASSGGKDSGYVAHILKYKYGMNPLTVTWAPQIYTDIGWYNFQALIHSGLDNILGTPNGLVHRKMTRYCFEEMGEPFQPFVYGQAWFPLKIALQNNINLVFDGENGEVVYGGDTTTEEKPGFSVEDAIRFWFSDKPLDYWFDKGFTKTDLNLYMPPPPEQLEGNKVEHHFFSYYKKWKPNDHYAYAVENCGFKPKPDGRSEGTYTDYASMDDQLNGFHYYLMLLKFGFGRATSDAAMEIRDNVITRERGVELVREYDTEVPTKYLKEFLDYCEITEDRFWEVCDAWRNENLWEKDGNEWKLKVQVS